MKIKVIPYNTLEYASLDAFPATGESGKHYLALDTMLLYTWSSIASQYSRADFRYEGRPAYHGSYLKSGYLEFTMVASPTLIDWHNGDYIRYDRTGRIYKLYGTPQVERQASTNHSGESFAYRNVQFYDKTKDLSLVPFRDLVPGAGGAQYYFSSKQDVAFTGTVANVVERLNANLANFFGLGVWNVRIADNIPESFEVTIAKDFSVSGMCQDALNAIYETWHELGWAYAIENGVDTIIIGYPNIAPATSGNRTNIFSYDNGLTALKRNNGSMDNFCTRMHVYGTERNLINRYYNGKDIYNAGSVNIQNLMIPIELWGQTSSKPDANKAFIEDADKIEQYGLITKDVYFDGTDGRPEIYPSIEQQTIEILKAAKTSLGKTGAGAPDYYPQEEDDTIRVDQVKAAVQMPQDEGTPTNSGERYIDTYDAAIASTIVNAESMTSRQIREEQLFEYTFVDNGVVDIRWNGALRCVLDQALAAGDYITLRLCVYKGSVSRNTMVSSADFKVESDITNGQILNLDSVLSIGSKTEQVTGRFVVTLQYAIISEGSGTRTITITKEGDVLASANIREALVANFKIKTHQIGFDIAKMQSSGGAVIAVKSGMCAGREFSIVKAIYNSEDDDWTLTCKRSQDTSTQTYYPNATFAIAADDEFVILGITMPEEYILAQAHRLYTLGQELFDRVSVFRPTFEPSIDSKKVLENITAHPSDPKYKLIEGKYMRLYDEELIDGDHNADVLISEITINEGEAEIATYHVVLSDRASVTGGLPRTVAKLSTEIEKVQQSQRVLAARRETTAQPGTPTFFNEGNNVNPVYFKDGMPRIIEGLDVPENIHTQKNVEAGYGVAAYGMASLAMNGGGGQGTVTAINFEGAPEQIYTPSDGLITLPDYPSLDGYATQAWVTNNFADKTFEGRVTTVESKIPAQASSTNQLADKNFVNSSVATATAEFQGTYDVVDDLGLSASATHAQIQSALLTAVASKQPDNNDYVFVSIPAVSGASGKYERYKFNGTAWAYEYTLNNSSFTAAQWASITSGITSAKVSDYDTHIARTDNPHGVTKAQVGLGNVENTALSTWTGSIKIVTLGTINTGVWHGSAIADDYIASASAWNAKYDKPSGGIPKTDLASAVQTSLGKADTALQSHQTIYNLTIKKNGTQVGNVYNPASAAQTIDITDVASASALSDVSTRVGTLEGYFSDGVANNAAQLGGQLPSYYAKAADYTKTSDFKSFTIKAGATSLGEYSPTSALILSLVAGSNIAFDTDATNHKLTIRNTYSYTLPIASSDSRGGIRVGNTLTIDSNGILNARIYDGLDSGSTTYALSAKQGKALDTALSTLKTGLTSKGAHNLPIYLNSSAEAVTIDSLSVPGDIQSTAGGVAASGIASLAFNGGGGQGTLTQIQVNGVALADTSGVVNITATTGNAAGKIAIAGQQIPVYGLGSLAYLSSLAFTDLSSHPTTLGGYGITDAKIANGVITLGGNTITPITSLPTFYNLAFQNASGTTVDTYKPTTSPSKTIKAGSNVTISAASNVITIAATDTTYESKAAASGGTAVSLVTTGEKYTWNNKQNAISDLSTIRSRADEGHTAYGWGNHADAGYFAASSFTKANIKSTLGISDWALAASKPSYAFSEITGTVTNAQLAGSIANSKLASAGKFTIGSTAIELGTTYTAANFRSYLGLGGAATYGATSSVTDGGTSLVTSGGVYSYVNALLTAAMKIEGETTTAISDGSTTNPVVIGGQSVSAYKGMVVFYGSKEFVWVGTNWKELGDESSFALKTTTVSGTGYLTGGGALSSNQTIDIASSVKTKIDNGATAYGWGNHANAGYALASNLGTASTHAHGDYVTGISWDSTNNKLAWSKGGTAQTAITIGYASSAGKLNTNAGSATNPVYFSGGVPVACTYSLNKTVPADAVFTDHTYNFSGTTFYSGNGNNAEHNANSAVRNGNYYYSSNGPAKSLGATTDDGALYVQSYSDSWVGQIAQDYRNGRLFVRGKNNGTWQSWVRIAQTGEAQPASDVYAWAKASVKPTYTLDEVSDGSTRKLANYLPLSGGTITGSTGTPLIIQSTSNNNYACVQLKSKNHYRNFGLKANGDLFITNLDGWSNEYRIWHSGNDGSGSGLDADLLDGQEGSFYATASSVTTLQGYFDSGVAKSAAKLTTVSKTAWGRTYWTSGGVPDNISGDMTNVGNIAFSASGKNIGGTLYFDTTNHRVGINDSTPSCAFDVTGDVQASGGIAAGGILNLAYNGAGTQGTLTQIQINGRALTDSSGIVNIPLANTTSTGDGAMSHSDKLKLDGIATGATNVTTDTVAGWGYIKDAAGIANALGYTAARENKKSRLVTGSEYRFQSGDNDCINIWIVSEANVNLYLPYDWDYQTPLRLIIANAYSGTVTIKYKATSGTQKIYSQSDSISLSVGRAALVEMIQFYDASVGGELTFITSTSYLQRSIT